MEVQSYLKIAITGATGFVGRHLAAHFVAKGDEVLAVSRQPGAPEHPAIRAITWQSIDNEPELLAGFDAIVNLAGETINQRWTQSAKTRILESRLQAADKLAKAIVQLDVKPSVVVNASAISIYGPSETETFDEDSPTRRDDFLSGVITQWEQAADNITGVRLVKLRTGVVLGNGGGAFPLMALPYRLFVGGRIGTGRQWMPWIHIDDLVGIIDYCISREQISGPVNAVAPNPVTNAEFGRAIAQVLHRPNFFPVPSFVFKLLFGEMSMLLLEGQHALPVALSRHGYSFRYPDMKPALRNLLKTGGYPHESSRP